MELRKIYKDKRGLGIGDIYPTILAIAIAGIALGVVVLILASWATATNNYSATVHNESSAATNQEAHLTVTNHTACGYENFDIIRITNVSSTETVGPTNYTVVDSDLGTWKLTAAGAASVYNNTILNVTYSFNYGGKDCGIVESISEDFLDFVTWFGIILLIVAAAIVLGIVISSLAGGKRV